jgi:hypothetical protein
VQSALADGAGLTERLGAGHAQVGEFSQGRRADEVTAHLVAREGGPVDQYRGEAPRGQPRRGRRPGRPAADDDNIAVVRRCGPVRIG